MICFCAYECDEYPPAKQREKCMMLAALINLIVGATAIVEQSRIPDTEL